MARSVAVVAVLLLTGCLAPPGFQGLPASGVIERGTTLVVEQGPINHDGDLIILEGGHLVLRGLKLTVHGSVVVHGNLTMEDAFLNIRGDGGEERLEVVGGGFQGRGGGVTGADAIVLQDASFSFADGYLFFGRLVAESSTVELDHVDVEASGVTDGEYAGSEAVHLMGSSMFAADSYVAVYFFVSEGSYLRLLNTGASIHALGGPGTKEIVQRLWVLVEDSQGRPVPNATVEIHSVPQATMETQGVTNRSGAVALEQIVWTQTTAPAHHDPHLLVVNGTPSGTSLATMGDQTVTVTYLGGGSTPAGHAVLATAEDAFVLDR